MNKFNVKNYCEEIDESTDVEDLTMEFACNIDKLNVRLTVEFVDELTKF